MNALLPYDNNCRLPQIPQQLSSTDYTNILISKENRTANKTRTEKFVKKILFLDIKFMSEMRTHMKMF